MSDGARCFVALRLGEAIERQVATALVRWTSGHAAVRWVRPENLHLTLKFLGDVERPALDEVEVALHAVRSPRLSLSLSGFGVFPSRGRVRVFWARVAGDVAATERLANTIEGALEPLGFATDPRSFRAHLTIGRAKGTRGVDELRRELAQQTLETDAVVVDHFGLYESELTPAGARYTAIARFALGSS